jgi:uncharacterized protein YgbK (DUF1537 family)
MTSARLDLAYYGDDLTGSTDVLEALSLHGVPTRLFLDVPSATDIEALDGVRAVGVAGVSRAMSPAWMDENLPTTFRALKDLGAPMVHYKVCSTCDSSPTVGSIGRVIEIGLEVFGCRVVPIIVGVPRNGRYTAFGHLFATALGKPEAHRIDRHPVMACHPRTPMGEADLVRHLQAQTSAPVHLIDFRALESGDAMARLRSSGDGMPCAVLIDVLNSATSAAVGRMLREHPWPVETGFVIGSSGVEYALMDAVGQDARTLPRPGAVDRLLVVSGSCSSTTLAQIEDARHRGWAVLVADPMGLLERPDEIVEHLSLMALEALHRGRSVVVTSAGAGESSRIEAVAEAAEQAGIDTADRFGTALGHVAATAFREMPRLSRVMVAGGDTSSIAGVALGIRALDMVAPIVPGSPLCRVVAGSAPAVGREILFKGGQVGAADHFERVRLGLTADEPLTTTAAA